MLSPLIQESQIATSVPTNIRNLVHLAGRNDATLSRRLHFSTPRSKTPSQMTSICHKKPNQTRFPHDCVQNRINTAIKRCVCRGRNHLKLHSRNFLCSRAGVRSLEANGGSIPGSVRDFCCRPLAHKVWLS